jgi:hypothetical protein
MTVVEPAGQDLFVGLGKRAETHLPPHWVLRTERMRGASLTALVILVQVVWVVALGYAAYHFLS